MSESRLRYLIREVYNHFNLTQFLTPTLKVSNNAMVFNNVPLNSKHSMLATFIEDKMIEERGVLLIGLLNYPMGIYTNEKIVFAHEDNSVGILHTRELSKYRGYRAYLWVNVQEDIKVVNEQIKELYSNIENIALLAKATDTVKKVRRT